MTCRRRGPRAFFAGSDRDAGLRSLTASGRVSDLRQWPQADPEIPEAQASRSSGIGVDYHPDPGLIGKSGNSDEEFRFPDPGLELH